MSPGWKSIAAFRVMVSVFLFPLLDPGYCLSFDRFRSLVIPLSYRLLIRFPLFICSAPFLDEIIPWWSCTLLFEHYRPYWCGWLLSRLPRTIGCPSFLRRSLSAVASRRRCLRAIA